jgi:SAM-dependent methyltransferase
MLWSVMSVHASVVGSPRMASCEPLEWMCYTPTKGLEGSSQDILVCGAASALPLAYGSFDFVVCSDLLEHVSEQIHTLVLDELFRIARDDGTVIVGAPCGVEARRCGAAANRR